MCIREFLLGKRLATKAIIHERLTNGQGLAIFSSDALSSTAYATEEILLVLMTAGAAALSISIPIAFIIILLIFLVTISYQQVIHAYPNGGGVYTVAKENLGLKEYPALIGAASLLIDYVLTASVSVMAGVAAITSAFPIFHDHRVLIGITVVLFLMWMNLRGVRESAKIFSIPTYFFIAVFSGMIVYGLVKILNGSFTGIHTPMPIVSGEGTSAIGMLLILRAFASGCTAMTGIEATSNGVPAFQAPEAKNAAKTILRMAGILGVLFGGLTILAYSAGIIPKIDAAGVVAETVVSQVANSLFGRNVFYFIVQGATVLILFLAANTPFADFPRVASRLAGDSYFPRQFLNLGSRLVFANGIIVLAGFSALFIYIFRGNLHALIPLYAVGVFLGFSLSQAGMVMRWYRAGPNHRTHLIINAIGCAATGIVFFVVLFSKFTHGAGILIPLIILLIIGMKKIHAHYQEMDQLLALDDTPLPEIMPDKTMVILVAKVNRCTLHGVQFARSFKPAHIQAVHVAIDAAAGELEKEKWNRYVPSIPMDVVVSEERDLIGATVRYVKEIQAKWDNDELFAVIPEFIPPKWWQMFLHNQTAKRIRLALELDPDINVEFLDTLAKVTTKLRTV